MTEEDYVSFETAKLLKEKGFDDCATSFLENGNMFPTCIVKRKEHYPAPTLQMAMRWLREMHKIDIDIVSRLSLNADDDHCYSYIIKHQYDKYHYKTYTDGEYLKFEEACEASIQYCLENLI